MITQEVSACLSDVIISDPNGQAMNPSSSCGDFVVTEEPVDPIVLIVGNGGSSRFFWIIRSING